MWLNRGNRAPFVYVCWSIHACCSWADIRGEVGGGGGGSIFLIINFMSILMQFLTLLKTNSRAEAMLASIQT